ncbi:MAG: dethiobiotin synthase, partial [Steroidobacteraceae bacterium]
MTRRSRPGLFIAGTDTGVGKTLAAVSIVRALTARGLRVAAMKPVAAGAVSTSQGLRNDDAEALAAASNVPAPYELINPFCLPAPVSPHIAAAEAATVIDIAHIARCFESLAARAHYAIVEGAGGWLAPIGERETVADVACALDLPVVLIVGLRLGCLNHALLSARAIAEDGLPLAGWIANHLDPGLERLDENVATLTRLLGRPPLAFIAHRPRGAPAGRSADGSRASALEPGVALPDAAG